MSNESLLQILQIVRIVFAMMVVAGLGGWLLAFMAQASPEFKKYKSRGILLIFIAIISGFGFGWLYYYTEDKIREEFIQIIKESTTTITQADSTFGQHSTEEWKAILTQERTPDIGHSGPTDCTTLTVKSTHKNFKVRICRDSHMPNKYWIFTNLYDMENGESDTGQIINDDLK